MNKTIGVFDSGIGGLAMVAAIKSALPHYSVVHVDDHEHLPYGTKTPDELVQLVLPKLQQLIDQGCDVIVIACNTVTTTIIEQLRQSIKIPLVGMEPMIKPAAAATKSGVIAVCATPATLASSRYAWLKQHYAQGLTVLEPDCSDWAQMIQDNQVDTNQITQRITAVLDKGADVIVLGCSHYHWIEELINQIAADRAKVIQPEAAVIAELKRVLEQLA